MKREWEVMESGTSLYWTLAWRCYHLQLERLEAELDGDSSYLRANHFRDGGNWAPLTDLALDPSSTFDLEKSASSWRPRADVWHIADGSESLILPAKTVLIHLDALPDRYYEGLGANYWQRQNDDQPQFIASALEGRWGGAAKLADALIVPADEPLLDAPERISVLVKDLYAIVEQTRAQIEEETIKSTQLKRPITKSWLNKINLFGG